MYGRLTLCVAEDFEQLFGSATTSIAKRKAITGRRSASLTSQVNSSDSESDIDEVSLNANKKSHRKQKKAKTTHATGLEAMPGGSLVNFDSLVPPINPIVPRIQPSIPTSPDVGILVRNLVHGEGTEHETDISKLDDPENDGGFADM